MKKVLLACVASLLSLLASGGRADDKIVNIYSWANIFDRETLDGFAKATGNETRYDTYESDEMLETKLLAGSSGYDIVTPSAMPFLQRQIVAGAIRKVDPSQLPNLKYVDPAIMALLKSADPGADHAIVAAWGTTGIGMNVDKVKELLPTAPVDSYALIFDPKNAEKLSSCGLAVIDSASDVIPIVLNYLGLDPNSENPDDIRKAVDTLRTIRPYLTYIDSGKYNSDLANGSICVALGWSGDIFVARDRATEAKNGIKISYVIPKEGTLAWVTAMAVPADAQHPEAAYAFMNYTMDPKVAAHLTEITGFPSAIPESKKYLPSALANNKDLFPPPETLSRLFMGSPKSDKAVRFLNRQWERFRSGE